MIEDDDCSESRLFREAMKGINQSHRNYKNKKAPRFKKPPTAKVRTSSPDYLSRGLNLPIAIDQTNQGDNVLFARPGLQRKLIRQLKRGEIPWESDLDLHGMRIYETEKMLEDFLNQALNVGQKCVLIIHGKGHHSKNREGALKPFTLDWLKKTAEIKAFCSANPRDGGTGAVYVLLKSRSVRT